jgi:glycosyltransferase involved in cell wall biosynthesis
MKKICFLSPNIFSMGGIQRIVSVVASELCAYFDVTILCVGKNIEIDREMYHLSDKVKVKIYNNYNIPDNSLYTWRGWRRIILEHTNLLSHTYNIKRNTQIFYDEIVKTHIASLINQGEYDDVVGVSGDLSLLLGIIAEQLNCRLIGWQHNCCEAYFNMPYKYFWHQDSMFKYYLNKLDYYVTLTELDKLWIEDKFDLKKCVEIPNIKSFKSTKKSNVRNKQFLFAGRFQVDHKGLDFLLDAFHEFSLFDQDWKLCIVGEGNIEYLENRVVELKSENRVEIHPFSNRIEDYFLESSILLLPSRWEGLPMIALESLEMGVPIIAFDIDAVKGIISHGKNGFSVEKYNVAQYAKYMYELAENEDLRIRMSKECVEKAKEFDVDVIIQKWIDILE